MALKVAYKDLSPEKKARIKEIIEEQEEDDIDLDDPDETVVETKKEKGRRIIVIEGPEADRILAELGFDADDDEVEDSGEESDDDDTEEEVVEEKPKRAKKADKSADEEPKEEPKPPSRSRYFGGR